MFLSYDNNGVLRVHELLPTRALLETLTASSGIVRVPLFHSHRMTGWASDVGVVIPQRLHRNPVAACVLASLGAAKKLYAGPIVITGFRDDQGGDLRDLTDNQRLKVGHLDRAVRAVLTYQPIPAEVDRYLDLHPGFADATRTYAAQVINGDVPPIALP